MAPPLPVRADVDHPDLHLPFWQRPFVQDVLPLVTSLLLHLALVVLGILTYQAVTRVMDRTVSPPIVPQGVSEITSEMSGLPQFHGLNDDPTRHTRQDKIPDVPDSATGLSDRKSVALTLAQAAGGHGDNAEDAIAIGAATVFGRGGGLGTGNGPGLGTGDAGPGLAPFGIAGDGGSQVFVQGPTATRIVFLCDSSGSMMSKFDALRLEIRKAIDHLRPNQQFDVIFFSADRYVALDKELVYALPENKRKAFDFLERTACHDSSDPIPGIRATFATEPDLIYMLTDGDFQNNAEVLAEIRKLNRAKKTRVNTIAFMERGEAYEKLLQQVADDTGGTFKFVSEQDLKQ